MSCKLLTLSLSLLPLNYRNIAENAIALIVTYAFVDLIKTHANHGNKTNLATYPKGCIIIYRTRTIEI